MEKSSGIGDKSVTSSDVEDSLDIAEKNWYRLTSTAKKTGYREGIGDGEGAYFQEGFDMGYQDAFKTAFALGKYKSLLNAMPKDAEHPVDIIEILDTTRRGACHICKVVSEKSNDVEKMSLSEIRDGQRSHATHTIGRLNEYFQPAIKRLNIDISDKRKMFDPPPDSSAAE